MHSVTDALQTDAAVGLCLKRVKFLFRDLNILVFAELRAADKPLARYNFVVQWAKPLILYPAAAFLVQQAEADGLIFDGGIDLNGDCH